MNVDSFIDSGTLVSIGNGRAIIGWGPRRWMPQYQPSDSPSFYFPDFFLTMPNPWFQHDHWAEVSVKDLVDQLVPSQQDNILWSQPNKTEFIDAFEDIQRRITSKELQKAVPFAFSHTSTTMSPKLLQQSLAHLLRYVQSSPLHVYGFWDKKEGILGASPELLFSKESSVVHTVALAGTYPKSSSSNQLLNDPKERHEHQLVVDGIVDSLKPYGKIVVDKTTVLELPTLYHLMTPIKAHLDQPNAFDAIVKSLHPTPALGASPKASGMQWLKHFQTKIDRRRFGAPAGVVYNNGANAHCWVAIRNIQWNQDGMILGAGCGVVQSSEAEKEWNEISLKMDSIKKILGFIA